MLSTFKSLIPRSYKRQTKRFILNICESILYRLTRERQITNNVHHIVFVCKGNICRSAFAEFYLRKLLLDKNIKIDSCGLDVDQGTQSPQDAVLVAREFEVDLSDHISKGLPACDLQKADLIVTMEFSQYLRLITKIPEYKKKTFILSEFAPWPACLMCNIYDPFGLGEDEFRRCFQKTKFSLDRLKNLISISQI